MKVSIVAAYNNKIEMTLDFLNKMEESIPMSIGNEELAIDMILVGAGAPSDSPLNHPFVTTPIILERNEGFTKVLNVGLKHVRADSDYVFFVGNDSFPVDDRWLPDLIKLQQDTGAWMVCPANDKPGMGVYTPLLARDMGEYWDVDFFPSIAWLMPYDKFMRVGLLDERFIRTGMYADNDYCRRIKEAGGTIVVSKNILLRHLLSAEGQLLGTQSEDMVINGHLYNEKWK